MSKRASVTDIELASVINKVEALLMNEPDTRSSDTLLFVRYMERYHGVECLRGILEYTGHETISRSRREIQHNGRCLPLESVTDVRLENQVTFSNFFGG